MTTIRRAPNTVLVVAALVAFVSVLAAVTTIIVTGKSPDAVGQLVDRVLTAVTALLTGGTLAYAASGARSARSADERLNGTLEPRIRQAAGDAVADALARLGVVPEGVEVSSAPSGRTELGAEPGTEPGK